MRRGLLLTAALLWLGCGSSSPAADTDRAADATVVDAVDGGTAWLSDGADLPTPPDSHDVALLSDGSGSADSSDSAVGADALPTDANGLPDLVSPGDSVTPSDASNPKDSADSAGDTTQPGSLITAAPYSCSCDGQSDDTACIQGALKDHAKWVNRRLIWPSGRSCIVLGLNWSQIEGSAGAPYVISGYGAVLKAANGAAVYGVASMLLEIDRARYLRVEGLTFDGNRQQRTLNGPEIVENGQNKWNNGYGIRITASADIELRDVSVLNAPMDGVLIRGLDATGPTVADFSKRITLTNPIIRNAYRNNISVINCDACKVLGDGKGSQASCQLTDANGIFPMAGIDFEPNENSPVPGITNSLVEGCYIARNEGRCIQLSAAGQPEGTIIRNNLLEDCRRNTATCGAALVVGHKNALVTKNTIRNFTLGPECRSLIEASSFGTELILPATISENVIENIAGVPGNGVIIYFHKINAGGHRFENNTLKQIGVSVNGDWCSDYGETTPNQVLNNTVDGVLQSPNPGCP